MDGMENTSRLLVIDDDQQIRSFIRNVFEDEGWLITEAGRGDEGIEMVRNTPDYFDLILLDINMPGLSGMEVLPELLKYGNEMAVIMMSGFAEVGMAVEAMKTGSYDYLEKPLGIDVLLARAEKALEQRRIRLERKLYMQDIEKKVRDRTSELEDARKATIFSLACLAEYRDEETGYHIERMANYCVTLTDTMRKKMGIYRDILDDTFLGLFYESASLHDIGKVGIPDAILRKPGMLTPEESAIMKTHTLIGARAIADIEGRVKGQAFLAIGKEVARSHHECFDGSGYPDGLKGREIPLSARILSFADIYDALSFPRIYRPFAYPHETVLKMMSEMAESKFDPDVYTAFLDCEGEFRQLREKYKE